jgi:hypothetical protein
MKLSNKKQVEGLYMITSSGNKKIERGTTTPQQAIACFCKKLKFRFLGR